MPEQNITNITTGNTAGGTVSSYSFDHNHSGNFLVVSVGVRIATTAPTVTVTYNGVSMNLEVDEIVGGEVQVAVFTLLNPAQEVNSVNISFSSEVRSTAFATSANNVTGVNGTGSWSGEPTVDRVENNVAISEVFTNTIPSNEGDLIIDSHHWTSSAGYVEGNTNETFQADDQDVGGQNSRGVLFSNVGVATNTDMEYVGKREGSETSTVGSIAIAGVSLSLDQAETASGGSKAQVSIVPKGQGQKVVKQFFTDFSEYTTGQTPNDWTRIWNPEAADITIEELAGATGGKVLRFTGGAGTSNRHRVIWDIIDENVQGREQAWVKARVKINEFDTGSDQIALGARISGSQANRTGYTAPSNTDGNEWRANEFLNGSFNGSPSSDRITESWVDDQWYILEMRLNNALNATVEARVYPDGGTEPAFNDMNVNNFDIPDGGIGVGGIAHKITDWDWVGIGVDGAEAPSELISGDAQGGSKAQVSILSKGQGQKVDPDIITASGGSKTSLGLSTKGQGTKATQGTFSATIQVNAKGQGMSALLIMVTLLEPENNAFDIPTTPMLRWQAEAEASRYQVQIARDTNYQDIVFDEFTEDTEITPPKLDPITEYHWRVLGWP